MSEQKDERLIIDAEPVQLTKVAGVNKVRVPAKFRRMKVLSTFFEQDLEMLVVRENGLMHLEIRRCQRRRSVES